MKDSTTFLKDIEVASRYKTSRSTIWRWIKSCDFPKPLKLGGASRWRQGDLEVWESSRESQEVLP